jgi:hypothetical protein
MPDVSATRSRGRGRHTPGYNPTGLYVLVRNIRAHAQNLQESVAEIRKALGVEESKSRLTATATALSDAEIVLSRSGTGIDLYFVAIRQFYEGQPEVPNTFGDAVVALENEWERAKAAWPVGGLDPDSVRAQLDKLEPHLRETVYYCGLIAIPSRLAEYLESLRVGQAISFDSLFHEELPPADDRKRVLLDIIRQPLFLTNGVVDATSGLVYRAAKEPWRRFLSLWRITGFLAFGFVLVALWCYAGQWLHLDGWAGSPKDLRLMSTAYLFLAIGSAGHILINALKESRAQRSSEDFVAVDDWLLWIHVRERSIRWGVVYLWCGLIMLAWTHSLDWRTAFFAGYSIDSVVDLFLDRFQKLTGKGTEAIKQKLA